MPRTASAITGIAIHPHGNMTRMYKPRGNGIRDIREVSGEFFLSVQDAWRKYGDEILEKVALQFPELFFAGMIKLCQVTKVEVGPPRDFSRLTNKEEIVAKLEERSGPEARKLFEKFIKDLEKLQAKQEQESG